MEGADPLYIAQGPRPLVGRLESPLSAPQLAETCERGSNGLCLVASWSVYIT